MSSLIRNNDMNELPHLLAASLSSPQAKQCPN